MSLLIFLNGGHLFSLTRKIIMIIIIFWKKEKKEKKGKLNTLVCSWMVLPFDDSFWGNKNNLICLNKLYQKSSCRLIFLLNPTIWGPFLSWFSPWSSPGLWFLTDGTYFFWGVMDWYVCSLKNDVWGLLFDPNSKYDYMKSCMHNLLSQ